MLMPEPFKINNIEDNTIHVPLKDFLKKKRIILKSSYYISSM